MKNTMKKLMTAMLAVITLLALTITAGAANPNANLSVKKVGETQATFTAYQVLKAEYKGVDSANKEIYAYTVTDAFKDFFGDTAYGNYKFEDGTIKTEAGDEIGTDGFLNTKDTEAAKLASKLEDYARANGLTGTDVTDTPASVEKGLYVISETQTEEDATNGFVASKPILVDLTTDKLDIAPKANKITLDKKIGQNENGTVALDDDDQYNLEANNKSIGDTINYRVESTIPVYKVAVEETIDKEALKYSFADTFTHIDFNADSMIVKINGVAINKVDDINTDAVGYVLTAAPDKRSFTLALTAKAILDNQGETIDLYYTGTLAADAVVDSADGNPNNVELTYSNNPNQKDSYDTLKDDVKTFTYGFKIHKVDKDDDTRDLAGAQFVVTDKNGNEIGVFSYDDEGNMVVSGKVTTDGKGLAEIKGVDAGKYTIEETVAPEGYSLIATPITVVITDEGGETTPNGTATIKVEEGSGGSSEVEVGTDNGDGTIDLIVKIKDSKGISLPETGAKTALYCMIGGVLLLLVGGLFFGLARKVEKR